MNVRQSLRRIAANAVRSVAGSGHQHMQRRQTGVHFVGLQPFEPRSEKGVKREWRSDKPL